jgi:LacI family transcriptional regulator
MVASTSRERFRGYEAALQQHGIPVDLSLIYDCEDLTLEEGISLSQRLLREHTDCDGIFAVTDTVALGAATALKQAGKRIPTDLAIAGFSDWRISSIVEPPLTSVAQPSLEMGRKAAELILREINATKDELPFEAETIILDTELKIRTSSQRRPAS